MSFECVELCKEYIVNVVLDEASGKGLDITRKEILDSFNAFFQLAASRADIINCIRVDLGTKHA